MAGIVWSFIVAKWLDVVVDIGIGLVAGAILFALFRSIGLRGLWSQLANLTSIGIVVIMYGHYWGWFSAPFILHRTF